MIDALFNWLYENSSLYIEMIKNIDNLTKEVDRLSNIITQKTNSIKEEKKKVEEEEKKVETCEKINKDHEERYKFLINEKNTLFTENFNYKSQIKNLRDEKNKLSVDNKILLKSLSQLKKK